METQTTKHQRITNHRIKPICKFNSSSSRWEFPEREGILTDRLGYGDISGWSRGTTAAKRPEVGKVERKSSPVHKLSDLKPFQARPASFDSSGVMLIGCAVTDNGARIMAKRSERIVPITERFAAHYKSCLVKRAKVKADKVIELPAASEEDKARILATHGSSVKLLDEGLAEEALRIRKLKGLYVP